MEQLKKLKAFKRHIDKMMDRFTEDESIIYHIKEIRVIIGEKIMDEELKHEEQQ